MTEEQYSGLAQMLSSLNYTLAQIRNQNEFKPECPLNKGISVYSQNEEDSIISSIIDRLDIKEGSFCEFGVGDGTENNTMNLVARGWKGFWVGGEDLAINTYSPNKNFSYKKAWVTIDNIIDLYNQGCQQTNINPDIISLDLDGNDYYFADLLLKNTKPKLFVVEFNAKFPPPIEFVMEYNGENQWDGGDYFGASLQSFNNLFNSYDYTLICVNELTGSNAFFIHKDYLDNFDDCEEDIQDIYKPPRYDRSYKKGIHGLSRQTYDYFFKKLMEKN